MPVPRLPNKIITTRFENGVGSHLSDTISQDNDPPFTLKIKIRNLCENPLGPQPRLGLPYPRAGRFEQIRSKDLHSKAF